MSIKSKFDVVKYLGSLIFKKEIKKQKGIMKILPGDKLKAEEKAKFAIQKLKERANINTDNLTKSDLEFIAEDIANPFKYGEKTVVKSADILPFRFKRSFAEELADAGKKGDFTRMQGIMKLDPRFKEVMKNFQKQKANEKLIRERDLQTKRIPLDTMKYDTPEIAKLKGAERMNYLITSPEQTAKLLKKGVTSDDIIYAQDRYGMTAKDMVDAVDAGFKFPFADGGVAGLLGERTEYAFGGTGGKTSSTASSKKNPAAGSGPAGGASAGGNYGGNVNPNQTYGGSGGGGSSGTTTTTTPPPKTGGASPFPYTRPTTGITSNYINPIFQKHIIDKYYKPPEETGPTSQLKTWQSMFGDVTPIKTFNTMEDLMTIPGATKEKLIGSKHKLTDKGELIGDFIKSSINLGNKNPNVSMNLDSVKNWMTDDKRQNMYKDYLNESGTDFNTDIKDAINEGLLENKSDFMNQKNILELAEGGIARQNFAMGRRAFLKLLGGFGAGIGALKTGAFKLLGKEAAPVAKEVVKDVATTSGPPPYFFNLVNKIKTLGDDTLPTTDKVIAKKYKDYVMEEDFAGNIEIIKKQSLTDNPYPEDVYMSYKVDEVPIKKGKKKSTKVEEYEEYTARPDQDGKMKDVEPGVPDDVIEDGTMFEDNITDFGKASGGIARMLGE